MDGYCVEIEEVVAAEAVATYQTVRSAELHVVDDVLDGLPELFVARHPTQRYGGEELEAVALGQTLGAVVTEVELKPVALVEVVGETARETLVALRQCVCGLVAAHHEHQQTTYSVLAKCAVVVESCVEVEGVVAIGGCP